MSAIDWKEVFLPDTHVLEILVRGTVMYLALFALLRVILKRQAGTLSLSDLLVVVLIADAAQNGMAGDYKSITDGVILAATIIFWSLAVDWLGYRFPRLHPFVHPPPLPLIRAGHMIPRNMSKELITSEELLSFLRLQGYEDPQEVKEAYLEGDGRISVIPYEKSRESRPKSPDSPPGRNT